MAIIGLEASRSGELKDWVNDLAVSFHPWFRMVDRI